MATAVRKKTPSIYISKKEVLAPIFEEIRAKRNGLLLAEDVVSEATKESSLLHPYFNWDDTEAAHQHRLWQARQLITIVMIQLPDVKKPVQQYVSMRDDRQNPGGAYRGIVEVMSDADLRNQMVLEALDDLNLWERKYSQLAELAVIFEAIQTTKKKYRRK